ncbi:hypothetical protein MED193_16949 [Roseobacter sp. MED193]|uniref:type IV secretory system conjugative DNA transfer family protein n=1 Tax=Roseobacter sp. MED193 TaxID=314262 RepID=UPI000068B917|nr:type IV secretory system conjugative DNA transfer family protein [Roseobacter sp. MED193]EAQ46901.1 hypothetical protein MED193_16949 [Roseobacter sp. MED193]
MSKGDRHCLTVAPTRSGKGTTQIIPNLLTYKGSTVIIDPKGENAKITAAARMAMGQDVQIVDPWNIANVEGFDAACFNPLDWLKPGDVDITEREERGKETSRTHPFAETRLFMLLAYLTDHEQLRDTCRSLTASARHDRPSSPHPQRDG